MKARLVVGNWKSYVRSSEEAVKLAKQLKRRSKRAFCETVVCPAHPHLAQVSKALQGSRVRVGGQDVSAFTDEKRTGEVPAALVRDAGATFSLIGHSESRAIHGDSRIKEKLVSALGAGLSPILCVGEPERDPLGNHLSFIEGQLRHVLEGLSKRDAGVLIVAYEPVWAIGKSANEAMKPMELQETAIFIRKVLVDLFGRPLGLAIPILYGGAVEPANAEELVREGGVDGLLVGHASVNYEMFLDIIAGVSKTQK